MVSDGGHRAGVHVGGGTQLQRDAPVAHDAGQPAEVVAAVVSGGDVVADAYAVAKAFGPAKLDGLPDGRQAEGLAGVDGDVTVAAMHGLERIEMAGRGKACLGAGDVEADHPQVAMAQGQLCDLRTTGLVAHGGEQRAHGERLTAGRLALAKSLLHRFHHLVQVQLSPQVQLRGEADLGVDHSVSG